MIKDALRSRLREIQGFASAEPELALRELSAIIDGGGKAAMVWMLKASVQFQQCDYLGAANSFYEMTCRKPDNELASLGLFHSHWSAGNEDAAFEEMKRFFRERGAGDDSQTARDYRAIVAEING